MLNENGYLGVTFVLDTEEGQVVHTFIAQVGQITEYRDAPTPEGSWNFVWTEDQYQAMQAFLSEIEEAAHTMITVDVEGLVEFWQKPAE